jgi:hypothetical protein
MSANSLPVDRLKSAWNPRSARLVALVLVFLCGAVVGALVLDLGVHSRARTPSFETDSGKMAYFEQLKRDLDLSPEQSVKVQSILEDLWQYYRTVLSDARQRIDLLLTPDQKAKFASILQTPPK